MTPLFDDDAKAVSRFGMGNAFLALPCAGLTRALALPCPIPNRHERESSRRDPQTHVRMKRVVPEDRWDRDGKRHVSQHWAQIEARVRDRFPFQVAEHPAK